MDQHLEAAIERARFLWGRQRHREAIQACHDALAIDPNDPEPMMIAGFCAISLDDMVSAAHWAGSLVEIAPTDPDGHTLLGIIAWHREKHVAAERHLRDAVRFDPEGAGRYAILAGLLGARGRLEEAITIARSGLKISPEDGAVLKSLQELYRLNDELELAEEFGRRAMEINPDDADHHLEAGLRLLEKGSRREARGRFLESLRIEPAAGESHEAIAHEKVRTHFFFRHGLFMPFKWDIIAL